MLNFGFICLEHQPLSLAGVVTESSCLGHAVALRPFFDVLRVCQDQASQGATPCQPVAGPHLAFGVSHRGQLQINAIHSGWSCSHMFSPIQSKKVSRDQHVYTCIKHLALRVCCGRWMSLRSLLTAADLMKQTSDLTEMQTKAWKMQSMPTTPSTFSKPLSPCKWASVQDLKEEAKWMDKSNDVKCLCYLCLPIIWISIILHPSSLPAFQPKLGKTSALLSCQAARELTELQALQDPGAGEEWKTAARTIQLIRQNIIFWKDNEHIWKYNEIVWNPDSLQLGDESLLVCSWRSFIYANYTWKTHPITGGEPLPFHIP